jgi:hypothetical protein
MTIDEAIKNLQAEKRSGTKSVIIAWWNADMFNRPDDEAWEQAADVVERKHDWSSTHDDLAMALDMYTSE